MTLEAVTMTPPATNGATHEAPTVVATLLSGAPATLAALANHRLECAEFWQQYPAATQTRNGDESVYADRRGNYSKGLPHNERGLVDANAYIALFNAATSGNPADFDAIPIGMSAPPPFSAATQNRPLTSPQAGFAVEMIGPDPAHLAMVAPPKFNSVNQVAEVAENYWMALARDVHFADFQNNATIAAAVADFERPLSGGGKLREALHDRDSAIAGQATTPSTIFRGVFVGERKGPYLAQFFLQDCFIGAQQIDQRMYTTAAGVDYMTDFGKWLAVQRGLKQPADVHDSQVRYMRNGRDLGQWVHVDQLYQAYLLAGLMLLDSGAAVSAGNPYRNSANQAGFATFGGPHLLSLLTEVATRALKAVWYQKWAVHRRLRPEAMAGRIHVKYVGNSAGTKVNFDVHPAIEQIDLLNHVYAKYGSLLLPMAFPEGSPTHPAYGAGHATVAGACTTILKAWFDATQPFSSLRHARTGASLLPVQASADGLSLQPYTGSDAAMLTIEGELNKLAGNVAVGRNFAGVHWRSDYRESVLLGEKIAIGTMMDYVGVFNEPNVHFQFNSFTGRPVVVTNHQVNVAGVDRIQQADSFSAELAVLD
ncbi:MAG: phosphoesterase [Caldilinea sp. CFX5]|nr:phosphoesterase [Caldilinea sp. CFX5]